MDYQKTRVVCDFLMAGRPQTHDTKQKAANTRAEQWTSGRDNNNNTNNIQKRSSRASIFESNRKVGWKLDVSFEELATPWDDDI